MKKRLSEKAWIRQTMAGYMEIEKLQPNGFDFGGEMPDWVLRLNKTAMGIFHPGLVRNTRKQWTAKDLGSFLGRQSAVVNFMCGEVPVSETVVEERKRCFAALEKIREQKLNPYWTGTQKEYTEGMKKWGLIFNEFINETIIAARQRPYPESSAFVEAFGKANVIKADELSNAQKMGVNERIAVFMMLFWRPISKLRSVAELHKVLSNVFKPEGIVITLKRVEKLCQRIGLKFKGRGRPKKSKIQTNPPVLV